VVAGDTESPIQEEIKPYQQESYYCSCLDSIQDAADHDNRQQKVSKMTQPSDAYRLEIAQDALGLLIALRSESIFHERKKAQPNAEFIDSGRLSETHPDPQSEL
jgi:hypothetical protein